MYSDDKIRAHLELYGWRRDVAGDTDFEAAVKAIGTMSQSDYLGLIISGDYGCGKSMLMRIVGLLYSPKIDINLWQRGDEVKLTSDYMQYYGYDSQYHVLLDDLGSELTHNNYGLQSEIVADWLMDWHGKMRTRLALGKHQPRLMITTNLNGKGIVERYGGRIYSRLKDLVIPLHLKGKDKRKWQVAK